MSKIDAASLDKWLNEIKLLYIGRNLQAEFEHEGPYIRSILEAIMNALFERYSYQRALFVGGHGITSLIIDKFSQKERVLKFSRPVENEELTASSLNKEGRFLSELRHQNIVEVEEAHSIEYQKDRKAGYMITHFVKGKYADGEDLRKHISKYIEEGSTNPSHYNRVLERFLKILHGISVGLDYVHSKGYVHLDFKPSNVMIDFNLTSKITDFGSAKNTMRTQTDVTEISFTPQYAHPDLIKYDPDVQSKNRAVIEQVKYGDVKIVWDIYSLGKSILEILNLINEKYPDTARHVPTFRYLHLMACRMLDGYNTDVGDEIRELAAGISRDVFGLVAYKNCSQIKIDIEKELGEWLPEREVLELDYRSRETIRSSTWRSTIITPRLKELISHPLLSRLAKISQLGLVRFIYPTASHSRYDHVIGTFTNTCAYVDALYHDQNPLFRQLMNKADIELILLTSLLHDLGQYPLAHDLQEVNTEYNHTLYTRDLLDDSTILDSKKRTIKQVIESPSGWNSSIAKIKCILDAAETEQVSYANQDDVKAKLLSTIIDGPIDADKTDYLMRDSLACHLMYGSAIDFERLMRTITVQLDVSQRPSLAIYAKGRAAAQSVAFIRYLMFTSVYWHHASRSCKTMLQYAFYHIVYNLAKDDKKRFQDEFKKFILTLLASGAKKDGLVQAIEEDGACPPIAESDLLLLDFLYRKGTPVSRPILKLLAERNLYKRLASISFSSSEYANRGDMATWNRFQKIAEDWHKKLALSLKIQSRILVEVQKAIPGKSNTRTRSPEAMTGFENLMSPSNLSVLIDIPPSHKLDLPLQYVGEISEKRYLDESRGDVVAGSSELWQQPMADLFKGTAVVRLFCHPDVRSIILKTLGSARIAKLAEEELSNMNKPGYHENGKS